MSTLTLGTPRSPAPVPQIAEVFDFARAQIHQAAADLWPHADIQLGAHVPSITGYVTHLAVDERPLYAKYSYLGMSLVSLLRGAGGTWPQVREAQADYVRRPDALLAREHAQLQLLAQLDGPRACAAAGLERGVLFTVPAVGSTLGDLLLRTPAQTVPLLEGTFAELRPLYRTRTAGWLGPSGAIGERSVAATFARKFNGISGQTYLDRIGADRCPPAVRTEVAGRLRAVVARLRHARLVALQPALEVLTYGELKPEHVVFPDSGGERPLFIDPGLGRGRATSDAAKLISRIVLRLLIARSMPHAATQVLDGVDAFAQNRVALRSAKAARSWQREVLIFWMMDTINLLSTVLSAPPGLPLNERTQALADRPLAACRLLDHASAAFLKQHDAPTAWHTALDTAREAIA
ncbi:hypothetical protein [Streptomyces sp. NPDC059262]|uniref:hypothetical protein n=1 Tax=Streptomyces sp. NPDC059262 TaxID=3346797 RepID=UPI00368C1444